MRGLHHYILKRTVSCGKKTTGGSVLVMAGHWLTLVCHSRGMPLTRGQLTCRVHLRRGWVKDQKLLILFLIPHINLLIPSLQGAPSTDGVGWVWADTFLTGHEIFTHVHLMFDQLWVRWGGREWREGGSEGVRKEGIVFCTCTNCPSILLVITARCLNLLSAVDFLPNVLPLSSL